MCLPSKVDDWIEDIDIMYSEHAHKGMGTKKKDIPNHNIVVTSFSTIITMNSIMLKWVDSDTTIIVDESQKIKTFSSKVTKLMLQLGTKTEYKIILSGTPQSLGYIDYYTQFQFLGVWDMTKGEFEANFCQYLEVETRVGQKFKQLVGYNYIPILDNIISDNVVYYARKDTPYEVSSRYKALPLPKDYNKLKRDKVLGDWICETPSALYHALRELLGSREERISALIDILESTNENVVVFYNYNHEKDILLDRLKGYNVTEFNGTIKDRNPSRVKLVQIQAGGTGVNFLTSYTIAVYYALPTSYILYEQSKARLDRIGQDKDVLYVHFYAKGTLEENIIENFKEGKDFDERIFMKALWEG